ncbi:MAG: hypothetical protein N2037_11520 [Acidimicrobiales bacterium]|nr:hypothetical protein [Acidimicrobiales bacterium]
MRPYSIVTERSSLSVSFKPAFPGLAARVTGLVGDFDVAIDDEGVIDWSQPSTGRFELRVEELSLGNRLLTMGARRWLDPERFDRIAGELLEVRPLREHAGDRRFASTVHLTLKDMDLTMAAHGRFEVELLDRITVYGRTFTDPRQFGVYLPPFLNFMVHVRWKITLEPRVFTPAPPESEPSTAP